MEVEAVLEVDVVLAAAWRVFAVPVVFAALVFAGVVFFLAAVAVVLVWDSASEAASTVDRKSRNPYFMFKNEGRSE